MGTTTWRSRSDHRWSASLFTGSSRVLCACRRSPSSQPEARDQARYRPWRRCTRSTTCQFQEHLAPGIRPVPRHGVDLCHVFLRCRHVGDVGRGPVPAGGPVRRCARRCRLFSRWLSASERRLSLTAISSISIRPARLARLLDFSLLWRVIEEQRIQAMVVDYGTLFGYAAASEYVLAAILTIPIVWASGTYILAVTCCACRRRRPPGSSQPPCTMSRHSDRRSPSDIDIRHFPGPSNPESSVSPLRPGNRCMADLQPYRGLFLLSPFLLLAPPGLYAMSRDRRTRQLAMCCFS